MGCSRRLSQRPTLEGSCEARYLRSPLLDRIHGDWFQLNTGLRCRFGAGPCGVVEWTVGHADGASFCNGHCRALCWPHDVREGGILSSSLHFLKAVVGGSDRLAGELYRTVLHSPTMVQLYTRPGSHGPASLLTVKFGREAYGATRLPHPL